MKSWAHLAAALPLTEAIYLAGGASETALAAGAASVLVDADHVADYAWLSRGRSDFRNFFRDYAKHRTQKLFLLLHSWELAALALGLAWFWSAPAWLWCAIGGWVFHLACDQTANRVGWPFYFLTYRFYKNFDRSRLPCPQAEPHP